MGDTKLKSALPKGEADGLSRIAGELLADPHRFRVILGIIDCPEFHGNNDDGTVTPVARIRRVEVVLDADLGTAEKLMRRALEQRSGRTVLPLDLEDDIAIAFRNIDPATGEKRPGPEPA